MPPDVTTLDLVALVWFVGVWGAYDLIQDQLLTGRTGINQHMKIVRVAWMRRMLERDNRMVDTSLIGHTMQSATFFASTTMLVLAGLLGMLGAADRVHGMLGQLSLAVHTSPEFFEMKLLLQLGIFVLGFFRFTWALRQYNYCCAMIGAAPLPPVPEAQGANLARRIAAVMTLAVTSFNGGLRSYYFAVAALMWLIHPGLFMAATAWVVLVLLRRQVWSRTYSAIRDFDASEPPNPTT